MKKYILLILLVIITTSISLADSDFLRAFKTCSPYSDGGVVKTQGIQATSQKVIEGWEGDRCVYKEMVSFSGINSTTTCKFTKAQLNEIVSVMQAYDLVQQYSNEKVDLSNLDEAQKNPVVKVWQKYFKDGSVCTISGLEGIGGLQ